MTTDAILGISRTSLRRKICRNWDCTPDAERASTLLRRRRNDYTAEELTYLAGFLVSGHDCCVLDNGDDYSAVEVWTARRNEARALAASQRLAASGGGEGTC